MTDFLLTMSAVISVIFASSFYLADRRDHKSGIWKDGTGFAPMVFFNGALLTLFLLRLALVVTIAQWEQSLPFMLLLGVYYCFLLCFVPLLRKVINARACGYLWSLPIVACITFEWNVRGGAAADALWIIPLPFVLTDVIFWLWLTGFAVCMVWKIISHLVFRRRLLRSALRVMDGPLLELWYEQQYIWDVSKQYFPLYICPDIKTPVSVGILHRTTFVALPDKPYSNDELRMIFRHELIHNGRRDGQNKLIMATVASLFWFNPLVWVAVRQGAEDLELSCDETALLGYAVADRRRYASLLLQTAADQRGFTSCLSGSAKSLRYRLKNVMKPAGKLKKAFSGIVLGLITFLICASVLLVAFCGPRDTLRAQLELDGDTQLQMTRALLAEDWDYTQIKESRDQEILCSLLEVSVSQLYSQPDIEDAGTFVRLWIETPEQTKLLTIYERYIHVAAEPNSKEGAWYMPAGEFSFGKLAAQITGT